MKLFLTIILIAIGLTTRLHAQQEAYLNPQLPVDVRVQDLISRLTPEEKVYQMMNSTPAIPRLHIPAYDWWNEALHGVARGGGRLRSA